MINRKKFRTRSKRVSDGMRQYIVSHKKAKRAKKKA